jgi:hypothetical protein
MTTFCLFNQGIYVQICIKRGTNSYIISSHPLLLPLPHPPHSGLTVYLTLGCLRMSFRMRFRKYTKSQKFFFKVSLLQTYVIMYVHDNFHAAWPCPAACPWPSCMFISNLHIHVECSCPCSIGMDLLHPCPYACSPCPLCMYMPMLYIHVHDACPCPCPWCMAACSCPCCVFMPMLHFHAQAWTRPSTWTNAN